MHKNRYIFTVVAGRSGQASLTEIINNHALNAYAAFEEPQINPLFKGFLGSVERKFRRKFIETDELLGRGKVLKSFHEGNYLYIEKIAKKRIKTIDALMKKNQSNIYIDISKFFARGLHEGFIKILSEFSLILLIRDPITNMRSFLNRNKNFYLDNPNPESKSNILQIDSTDMEKGELYLWIWCELYLRFKKMKENTKVVSSVEIRTEMLDDPKYLKKIFQSLNLNYNDIKRYKHLNTNQSKGFVKTKVKEKDLETFERFINRIPQKIRSEIKYLENYEPKNLL